MPSIETKLAVLKWMAMVNIVLTAIVLTMV
jgi:hypothetical protein